MQFQKGHKYAKGGRREGSGRKPDAFKWVMQEIADSPKFIRWLMGIVDGTIESDPELRLKAWKEARDSGYGKPAQTIGAVDADGKSVPYSIVVMTTNGNGDGSKTV